ncbi:MAG: endolytic transglycosylase MltG, partial [Gammaproteobacteria bacterium]|nr:endolytic transglycosylase MltG [Gammaproteobacteria bacterium]
MKKYFTKKNVMAASLIFIAVILLAFILITKQAMTTPNTLSESQIIEIKPGATIRSLAVQLEQHNLVKCPKLLILWTRLNGDAKRIQVGEYIVQPATTLSALMDDVTSGRVRQYSLKLLEGWTFKEFMQAINSHEAIKHELTDLSQKEILERLEIKHEHPEGLFFPETYNIHKNISDID